jgi:hypothetical protein
MQYEVELINSKDQKWNITEARTNHPQGPQWVHYHTEFAPQTSNTKLSLPRIAKLLQMRALSLNFLLIKAF